MKFTKFEEARVIGARALQISMGAPLLIKSEKEVFESITYSPIELAKLEFKKNVLPITIKRPLPGKLAS